MVYSILFLFPVIWNLLFPRLSIPYEHLYNINVLLGNPLIFSPPFFIQLLVMVFFILHCLSNQNTQHSEHVDLTVSIHKHFKSLNVILKLNWNFYRVVKTKQVEFIVFGCFVACRLPESLGYMSEIHVFVSIFFYFFFRRDQG